MSTAYEFGRLLKKADETWAQRAYKSVGQRLGDAASSTGRAIADGAGRVGNAIVEGARAIPQQLSEANDAFGREHGWQFPTHMGALADEYGRTFNPAHPQFNAPAKDDVEYWLRSRARGGAGAAAVAGTALTAGAAAPYVAAAAPYAVGAGIPLAAGLAAGSTTAGPQHATAASAPKPEPSMFEQAGEWVKNNPGYAALGAGGLGLGAYGLYNALQSKKKRTKASADGRDRVLNKSGFYVPNGAMSPGVSSDMAGFIMATSEAKKKQKPKHKNNKAIDILHERVKTPNNSGTDIDPRDLHAKSAQSFGSVVKRASMLGDFANGLSTSWNNASRVFKGGTGAAAGALGAVGAGLTGGAMQGANAVGGLFGQQPFSNETVDTAYGTADHYANMGSAYGKDLAQGLGLGPQGLAGTTMNNPSAGDDYIKQVQNMPGVTDEARRISNMGMSTADLASKAAPAAALGGGIQMASNVATGAPLTAGISSASPAATAAPQALGAGAKAVQKATGVAKNLNSSSNPLGWGTGAGINAVRQYQNYQPATALAGK